MNILEQYNIKYPDMKFSYIFVEEVMWIQIESKNELTVIDIDAIQSNKMKSEFFRFKIKEEDFLKLIKETYFLCDSEDPIYQNLNKSAWNSFLKRNNYKNHCC